MTDEELLARLVKYIREDKPFPIAQVVDDLHAEKASQAGPEAAVSKRPVKKKVDQDAK